MNDIKNILLAWFSSITSLLAVIESRTWLTISTAIVLPIIFFLAGKAIDICLQVYLFRHKQKDGEKQ